MTADRRSPLPDAVEELRLETEHLSAALRAGPTETDRYRGSDATGTITAEVDGTGRFVRLDVATSWRRVLGPAGLSTAVVEAIDAADQERVGAWVAVMTGPAVRPTRADRRAPVLPNAPTAPSGWLTPSYSPGDPAAQSAMRHVIELTRQAVAALPAYGERVNKACAREYLGHTRSGHVTAVVRGGRLLRIEASERWLDRVDRPEIARELNAAIQAVFVVAQETITQAQASPGAIDDVRAITGDLEGLLASFGFTEYANR